MMIALCHGGAMEPSQPSGTVLCRLSHLERVLQPLSACHRRVVGTAGTMAGAAEAEI